MESASPNTNSPSPSTETFGLSNFFRGIGGAVVGGVIGLFVFRFLYQNNLHAPLILGGALGLGASFASGGRSIGMGILCFVLGGALTLAGDWSVEWFAADESFLFYLQNLQELGSVRLLMIGLSAVAAGYFGAGR